MDIMLAFILRGTSKANYKCLAQKKSKLYSKGSSRIFQNILESIF